MRNFLILINNAPKMAPYHKALGDRLKAQGNTVIYAFSDKLPLYTYKVSFDREECYFFSDFFKENESSAEIPYKYKDLDLWKSYFSDYDRYTVHYNLKNYDVLYYERLLTNLVCFFDKITESHNVDVVVYENVSNSFAYTCFEVAKINNVEYRGYVNARLNRRFELHTEEFGIKDRFKAEFEKLKTADSEEYDLSEVDTYLGKFNSKTIPSYHPKKSPLSGNYSLIERYLNVHKLILLKGAVIFFIKENGNFKYSYQVQNPLIFYYKLYKRQIKKKYRVLTGKSLFEKHQFNEKYFLFPMHFKPESSTSVLAKNYNDDIAVIKNIAFNLPFGYKLYVKEHFVNFGNYPLSFYKELKKIPNLRLISSDANTMELVKKCKALITLTGTMGYEALLMNKNVLLFGNVFYEAHPNCIKINNFDELWDVVRNLKEIPINYKINQAFVAAYRSCTFEGNVAYSGYNNEDHTQFTKAFLDALHSHDAIIAAT